jgi:hypothetical protein
MAKKSFNRLALLGMDVDDMDFVKEFNLNPNVAYTNAINDEMLNLMYNENVDGYMLMGDTRDAAQSKAGRHRAKGRNEINKLLKKNNMKA